MNKKNTGLLILLETLLRESDAEHPMTLIDLQLALEEANCYNSPATIHRNINKIRDDLAVDLHTIRGKHGGYYIGNRMLQKEELILMIDAIKSSNIIDENDTLEITEKLKSILSVHEGNLLERNVQGVNVAKTENNHIIDTINRINDAINHNKKITFTYLRWNENRQLVPNRKNNIVSPWLLIWTIDRYYLFCYKEHDGVLQPCHYRVDKIRDLKCLDESRDGEDLFQTFNPTTYVAKRVGMFSGEEQTVTLIIDKSLIGVFIDQFGKENIHVMEKVSPDWIKIYFKAVISPVFCGWLLGLEKIQVISKDVFSAKWNMLFEANTNYNENHSA